MIETKKTLDRFLIVTMFFYMVLLYTPYLSRILPSVAYAGLFIFTLSLSLINSYNHNNSVKFPFFVLIVLLWCMQIFLYRVVDLSTCSYFKVFSHIIEVLFFYLIYTLLDINSNGRKIIAFGAMLIFYINLIDNIRLNIIYPNASEMLNFSYGAQFLQMNVGGSAFVSLASVFGLLALVLVMNVRKTSERALFVIYFITCLIYIIITGRAISLISFAVGTGIIITLFFLRRFESSSRIVVCLIISYLIILTVVFVLPPILLAIASSIEGSRLVDRFNEIAYFLQMRSSEFSGESSGEGRKKLYLLSVQTFLSNVSTFLIGIGEHPSDVEVLKSHGIGAHSAILDNLPEYGLFGAIAMITILREQFKISYGRWKKNVNYLFACVIFVIWIFNCFINNAMGIGYLILVYMVIPAILLENDVDNAEINRI